MIQRIVGESQPSESTGSPPRGTANIDGFCRPGKSAQRWEYLGTPVADDHTGKSELRLQQVCKSDQSRALSNAIGADDSNHRHCRGRQQVQRALVD
jgi:hypothetical protein